MNWILPGTVLAVDGSRPEAADELFSSLFVTGGLVLSQVCQITGLEPYAVQNWVKRGFLAPPVKKKYNRRQLSRMEKKKNGGVTKTLVDKSQRSASSELDLRGQTIEEAIMMVDQFIDSCTLLGIKTITIIHGKGTGALRKAVHEILRRNKAVKSFRLGRYGEGEAGVTIVELK